MRFNIPAQSDIDAAATGDLTCFTLMWPNTRDWRAILGGLLWLMARGRTWNETTGDVRAIQAAGYRLFEANFPLRECERTIPSDGDDDGAGGCSGGGVMVINDWEEMMAFITDVTIENGRLVLHYGPCCEVVVDGTLSTTTDPESHDPYDGATDPNTEQPYVTYTCGKAAAMVNAVWAAWTALVNNADDPTGVIGDVKASLPGVSFNTLYLWDAYLQLLTAMAADQLDPLDIDSVWDADNLLDDVRRETWLCRLADAVSEGGVATEGDVNLLKSLGKAQYSLAAGTALGWIMNAIGDGDLKAIGTSGAINNVDCTCPELHPAPAWYNIPEGMTWAYLIDFTTGQHGFTLENTLDSGYVAGVGFRANVWKDTIGGHNWAMARITRASDGTGTNRKLHYMAVHSSALPTGTHMRNSLHHDIAGGAFGTWSQLPLLTTYEAYVPAGTTWANSTVFHTFQGVTFDTGADDQGYSTIDMLVLAGTGTPPYGDLTNLLA